MSGDRSEDDETENPPEDQPRDEPPAGERGPPPEESGEPRGEDRRPPAEEPPRDEPPRGGGRRDEPRGGRRQPPRGGPSATDILKRQENMTLLKTWAALYALIGVTVGIGSALVGNVGGSASIGGGFSSISITTGAGPGMVGAVLAFGPLLAAVVGREVRANLDQDTRALYITAAATAGIGSLAMGFIGGIMGLAIGLSATGVLVGAILMALLSAGVGAGAIWISDWAERSSQPRRPPAGGRQREGEPRGEPEPRDDRQPR